MKVTPYLLGSGKAATAITESIHIVGIVHPEFSILPLKKLTRGESLKEAIKGAENPVLFIANPHALHAKAILEGEAAGFKLIVCEKPIAVSPEQVKELKAVKTPVAVLHVYRQMWGIQTLKEKIEAKEFGEIISIEGRYWQSSAAQKALLSHKTPSWKNDPTLSGPSDVLLDIGTHWIDAAAFIKGELPRSLSVWKSYVNAESSHRDTHIHLTMDFNDNCRAMSSVSKTVHGAPNHFEINIIGSKKYASWKFLEADQIEISEGSTRSFISRSTSSLGSGHWPYHGLGWIEGYVEIIYQAIKGLEGKAEAYPNLEESLDLMELVLKA